MKPLIFADAARPIEDSVRAVQRSIPTSPLSSLIGTSRHVMESLSDAGRTIARADSFERKLDEHERRPQTPKNRQAIADLRERVTQIRRDIEGHEQSILRLIDMAVAASDHDKRISSTRESRADRVAAIRQAIAAAQGIAGPNATKEQRVAAIAKHMAELGIDPRSINNLPRAVDGIDAIMAADEAIAEASRHLDMSSASLPDFPTSSFLSEPRAALTDWGLWALRLQRRSGSVTVDQAESLLSEGVARMIHNGRRGRTVQGDESVAREFLFVSATWASCGFPIVQPTHKLAASLMATDIPSELVPEIAIPWPAFVVAVPDGLITYDGIPVRLASFVDTHARGMPAEGRGKRYVMTIFAHSAQRTALAASGFDDVKNLSKLSSEHGPEKSRAAEMLGRLVLGALIELDSPAHKAMVQQGPPPPKQRNKREEPTPRAWIFELRRDVKVDARSWVREYVSKGGKSPSVQVLVRGHMKRQPWGKGRAMRKWIQIEPFWRGSADAPIAVRAHRMKGRDE